MKLTRLNELIKDGKIISGRWRLGKDNLIVYESEGSREEILFKGMPLAVGPDGLVVSIEEKRQDQKSILTTLTLVGSWSADSKNRLRFEVEKTNGRRDAFVFKGSWELNHSQELVYIHEVTRLKTKTNVRREIVFQGFWDISEKNRLTYRLGGDDKSVLHFRCSFETKSLLAKKGEIRYQLGVEGSSSPETVTLFGKWKMSDRWGLFFEVEYRNGKKHAIIFGAESQLGLDGSVRATLKSRQGERLGLEVVFTKDIPGGEAFLRLLRDQDEGRVEAGARFTW